MLEFQGLKLNLLSYKSNHVFEMIANHSENGSIIGKSAGNQICFDSIE